MEGRYGVARPRASPAPATTLGIVATLRDDAICIRHWDWSETSQTVTLLGRQTGLIRGIAKGAKREKAQFSGGLEVLTRGEVVAVARPNAALATLTAWDLQESFPALRRTLRAFHCGMYFADLVQHLVSEGDPHPALFDELVDALRALALPGAEDRALLRFQWAALSEAGYKPELDADVIAGDVLPEAPSYSFRPGQGGLSRDPALPQGAPKGQPGPSWRVRHETVQLLRALSGAAAETIETSPLVVVGRANRLLAYYIREILGRQPASMAGVFGLSNGVLPG
jgi:DNA repair protein RecO (recombination protein O)